MNVYTLLTASPKAKQGMILKVKTQLGEALNLLVLLSTGERLLTGMWTAPHYRKLLLQNEGQG